MYNGLTESYQKHYKLKFKKLGQFFNINFFFFTFSRSNLSDIVGKGYQGWGGNDGSVHPFISWRQCLEPFTGEHTDTYFKENKPS